MLELMQAVGKAARPRIVTLPRLTDAELAALPMPILAIVGGKDALISSAETRDRLQRFAPHAEVRYLPDGYHFLPGQTHTIERFLTGQGR